MPLPSDCGRCSPRTRKVRFGAALHLLLPDLVEEAPVHAGILRELRVEGSDEMPPLLDQNRIARIARKYPHARSDTADDRRANEDGLDFLRAERPVVRRQPDN